MTGLVAATASADTTGPVGHHQLARVRCGDRQRHDGHRQRRGDRRRRARGRRRGLHRRCVLAPGGGHDRVELHLRAVRARVDAGAGPRRRRQRQHRRDRHPVVHRGVPVLDLRVDGPEDPRRERPGRGRAGPEVLLDQRRVRHRGALLQGLRATPGRTSVRCGAPPARGCRPRPSRTSRRPAGRPRRCRRRSRSRPGRRTSCRTRHPPGNYALQDDAFWYGGVSAPPLQVAGGFGASGSGTFGARRHVPGGELPLDPVLRRRRLLDRRHHTPDDQRPVAHRRLHQRARRLTGQRGAVQGGHRRLGRDDAHDAGRGGGGWHDAATTRPPGGPRSRRRPRSPRRPPTRRRSARRPTGPASRARRRGRSPRPRPRRCRAPARSASTTTPPSPPRSRTRTRTP